MQIIHECMAHADKLFENFSLDVDRKTQAKAWQAVMDVLIEGGINVESVPKMKQNVSNWVRRATVITFLLLVDLSTITTSFQIYRRLVTN